MHDSSVKSKQERIAENEAIAAKKMLVAKEGLEAAVWNWRLNRADNEITSKHLSQIAAQLQNAALLLDELEHLA